MMSAGMVITLILPLSVYAQQTDELLKLYFTEVRQARYPAIPKPLSLAENARAILVALEPYQRDTIVSVRAKAYTITQLAGNNARESGVRQDAVSQLVRACKDKDSGNAGLALEYLTVFRKDDFTPVAKDSIRILVRRKSAHFDQLIRLAGFAQLTDLMENIRSYSLTGNTQTIRWAAIVSLARMNDAAATSEMMRRVQKLPVNDDVIYKIFPDLAYSRRQEAIAYMVEALNSDDRNCLSADAEKEEAIPCGYRIMEQLAPVIDGYPLELDKSGDIKTKDYVAALKTVREWFVKHPDYKILRDRY
jgi:hypothetical protein